MSVVETHPVQVSYNRSGGARVSTKVTARAYEVYCRLYSPQPAIVTGDCRGGFGANELIAFLYARGFPESEWRARVDEALLGMEGI